jgi:hypothetical protein
MEFMKKSLWRFASFEGRCIIYSDAAHWLEIEALVAFAHLAFFSKTERFDRRLHNFEGWLG